MGDAVTDVLYNYGTLQSAAINLCGVTDDGEGFLAEETGIGDRNHWFKSNRMSISCG